MFVILQTLNRVLVIQYNTPLLKCNAIIDKLINSIDNIKNLKSRKKGKINSMIPSLYKPPTENI